MAIDLINFSDILDQCLDTYIPALLEEVKERHIYSLGLYTSSEFLYVSPTANTVESLNNSKRKVSPTSFSLKWSVPDWEYHNWRSDIFSSAEECLLSGWDENFEDYAIESEEFLRIVIKTLKNPRNRYFKEADVLISLFLPSVGHEMSKTAAVKINSFGVAEQYLNDLQRLYGV